MRQPHILLYSVKISSGIRENAIGITAVLLPHFSVLRIEFALVFSLIRLAEKRETEQHEETGYEKRSCINSEYTYVF